MGADLVNCLIADIAAKTKNALVGGPFGSNLVSKDYVDSGIPVIRGQNMGHGRWVMGDFVFVAPQKANELSANTARPGDLVFTQRGTLGQVAIVPEGPYDKYIISQSQMKLTVDHSKADTLFLYYLFCTPEQQDYIKTNSIQVGVPHTNLGILRGTPISLPPIEDQHAIAKILSSIDDKIELNRQINQTLEQIAQTLFKSWFVDFEPVKAKIEAKAAGRDPERAAMCAISGKLEPELDQLPPEQRQQLAATAALFPDELVESELGLIPLGWELKSLPEAIEVNPARKLKKGAITPYLDMANVPTNSARVADVIQREFSSGSKFMNGDTLLARITPCLENGKTAYVDFLADKQVGWGSTEFIVFRPKAPLPEAFGYLLCRHPEFRAFAIANMSGTSGRQRVPNDCFANYKLTVPSRGVATSFGETVAGIMDGIKARDEEARTLATLRDTLLPKLLSGEHKLEY